MGRFSNFRKIIYVKNISVLITKIVSDSDFLFAFNVYHMDDKDESDLVMVSNESGTDSNPRKRQGTLLSFLALLTWSCELLSPLSVCRPSVNFSHFNQLL